MFINGVAHIGGSILHLVHIHVKIFNGNMGKNLQLLKLAQNLSKNAKSTKQMSFPSIWGNVGVKKWSLFLDSASKVYFFGT